MRLAVDATPLLGRPTGVGAFARAVLDGVAGCDDLEVTAFALTWRGRHALAPLLPPGVEHLDRALPARPLRAAWRRSDVPRLDGALGRPDVMHGTNFVVPPARAARVVTVHDLTCIRFPELCTADTLEYPALLRRAIAAGAWVHAVSGFVAEECVSLLGASEERVVAVPNGVAPAPADPAQGPTIRARLVGGDRYVLALGTVEPRKDLPGLVAAFELVADADPDVRLVLAGPDGWGAEALTAALRRARHRDRVRRIGWVDATERAALLRGATAFAYPSVYEGFGLPPLEAMSAGVPVVTTAAGAIPETVGDAALVVPVGDREALARALTQVLEDDTVRRDLVVRGGARVASHPWATTIDGLVALYRRAADG